MTIVYRLVSYDKKTERKRGEVAISGKNLAAVKEIAGILSTDDGLGDYPLSDNQANNVARLLKKKIDCDACTYFVEPYDVPATRNRA